VHSWSTFGAKMSHGQLGLTRLTTAQTWGKPPPSPLLYTLCLSTRSTSKWHFVPGLPVPQMGVSKLLKLRLLWFSGPITLCADLGLRWSLKQSYSPHWDFFNNMSHATCTQGNWVDSRLLMVGNQTANLTPDLSFGHNLCFRCPNGHASPFQTYKFQYLLMV
jgi:hypothetical protein